MKKWSNKYNYCISCKKDVKPHKCNGLCSSCWFKYKYKDPIWRDNWKKTIKNWRDKNKKRSNYISHKAIFKYFLNHYEQDALEIVKLYQARELDKIILNLNNESKIIKSL